MRRLFFLLLTTTISSFTARAQGDPFASTSTPPKKASALQQNVRWTAELETLTNGDTYMVFVADVTPGWYIYSANLKSEDGPVKTSFDYQTGVAETLGKVEETSEHTISGYDELFGMEIIKYKENVTYRQKVKLAPGAKSITGYLEYMMCDESRCLPPKKVYFDVAVD